MDGFRQDDPKVVAEIERNFHHWDDVDVFFKGRRIVSGGHGFCGIGRLKLLNLLHQEAEDAGVRLEFDRAVADVSELGPADLLVAAIGRPRFFGPDHVKPGATVIDVGINRLPDGKLCGDVDFASASEVASLITPVPGGVGPMTIAMLMSNTVTAAERSIG